MCTVYSNYIKIRIESQLKFIIICSLHIRLNNSIFIHSLSLSLSLNKLQISFSISITN